MPLPRHGLQRSFAAMTCPPPPHRSHLARMRCTNPGATCANLITSPDPPHSVHWHRDTFFFDVPAPSQRLQIPSRRTASFVTFPLYNCSSDTPSSWTMSFVRRSLLSRRPPPNPKKLPNRSNGSEPPLMPPDLTASSPTRSYSSRFLGSLSTPYACPSSLNWSVVSRPGFLSGCSFIASFRYAFLMARASAVGLTPSTS